MPASTSRAAGGTAPAHAHRCARHTHLPAPLHAPPYTALLLTAKPRHCRTHLALGIRKKNLRFSTPALLPPACLPHALCMLFLATRGENQATHIWRRRYRTRYLHTGLLLTRAYSHVPHSLHASAKRYCFNNTPHTLRALTCLHRLLAFRTIHPTYTALTILPSLLAVRGIGAGRFSTTQYRPAREESRGAVRWRRVPPATGAAPASARATRGEP